MSALGVMGYDQPPPHQPRVVDGIHLRWAFPRDVGFPWYGYYLYRRPSVARHTRCFSQDFAALRGSAPTQAWTSPLGRISSNVPLATVSLASGGIELDLRGRLSVRFDLPVDQPAQYAIATVRFAGVTTEKKCVGFASIPPRPLLNPFSRDNVTFTVRHAATLPRARVGDATPIGGGAAVVTRDGVTGLDCADGVEITLPAPTDFVSAFFYTDGVPVVRALNAAGAVVAEKSPPGGHPRPGNQVELTGHDIRRVVIAVNSPTLLGEICYRRTVAAIAPPALHEVLIRALDGNTVVAQIIIGGAAGTVGTAELRSDRITAVEVDGAAANLVDLCTIPVADGATEGWQPVLRSTSGGAQSINPIILPVESESGYPAPRTPGAEFAEDLALGRVRYGSPFVWRGAPFTDVHQLLRALVKDGPAGGAMADRFADVAEDTASPGSVEGTLHMPRQRPLDLLLLGALHPAIAQMLGLYWIDDEAPDGVAFDYLIIADHDGRFHGKDDEVLAHIATAGFGDVDAWICFYRIRTAFALVPPPANVRAYALPGATRGSDETAQSGTGLQWSIGSDVLGPAAPVMYHLWRREYGSAAPAAPADAADFVLLTADAPILVTRSAAISPHHNPPHAPDWPAAPMQTIDAALADGWYGYRISGIDLFGRYSEPSADAIWSQWEPQADLHPFAIQHVDRVPPPPPTGIEAAVLDPLDPFVDSGGSTEVRLRVRWLWPASHRTQAPDAREFRVYFAPGSQPPASWSDRLQAEPMTADEKYEVILTAPAALAPTLATPVVYGNVTVTAADAASEGRAGAPATVFRVLRTKPAPPAPATTGERVFASPADWRDRSFYTYRWRPSPNLKLHICRALDESVFLADWDHRPLPTPLVFPDETAEPRWNAATRQKVTDALDPLNGFAHDDLGTAAAMAHYRALSDDALRVLASQDHVSAAFAQITTEPLDPGASANLRGPDTPDSFVIDSSLRAYVDVLDGRGQNRYLYRSAYVDGAHNRSALGMADPPVYLPRVTPPAAPVITSVTGGERQLVLVWAAKREPNGAEYRIYRTEVETQTRDVRLMNLVHRAAATEVSWTDVSVEEGLHYYYRIVAADSAGHASPPSVVATGRAYDYGPPAEPMWERSEWIRVDAAGAEHVFGDTASGLVPAVALVFSTRQTNVLALVQRHRDGEWHSVTAWRTGAALDSTAGVHRFRFRDTTADPRAGQRYRARLMTTAGVSLDSVQEREVSAPA